MQVKRSTDFKSFKSKKEQKYLNLYLQTYRTPDSRIPKARVNINAGVLKDYFKLQGPMCIQNSTLCAGGMNQSTDPKL